MRAHELTEGLRTYDTPKRSEQIEVDKARSLLATHPITKTPIYRGVPVSSGPFSYVRPSQHHRLSANTKHYATLLMSHMPAWQKYPKRSQSIICSTLVGDAESYAYGEGTSYRVLPKQGSKIGVCPSYDFWYSFPLLNDLNLSNITDLNRKLDRAAELFLPNESLSETNYDHLVNQLDYISKKIANINTGSKNLIIHGSILETLEVVLHPENNGFLLQTTESYSVTEHREVWTDGDSLLVDATIFDDFIGGFNASN